MLYSNDCGCVIYECTVSDEGVLVWSESAFECIGSQNEIILFSIDLGFIECNNGAVKAQRNNYTSHLIIMDRSLIGSNIKCIYENSMNSNVIGNLSIPTIAVTVPSGK